MLAKYFLCEQNFYSVPLQRVKKMDECWKRFISRCSIQEKKEASWRKCISS